MTSIYMDCWRAISRRTSSRASTRQPALSFALAAFAAGFAIRPFGALVFGRVGDLVEHKNTFLVTMGIVGLSTFVGLLPGYNLIGVAAPIASGIQLSLPARPLCWGSYSCLER
jgi:MFS family permease